MFHAYNLDIVFIIKILLEYNWINNSKNYKLETVYKNNVILKQKIMNRADLITILDSYHILTKNSKYLY